MHELVARIQLIVLDVPGDLAIDQLHAVLDLSESVPDDSLPFLFDEAPELEAVERHGEQATLVVKFNQGVCHMFGGVAFD